jgi:hypothetical protein
MVISDCVMSLTYLRLTKIIKVHSAIYTTNSVVGKILSVENIPWERIGGNGEGGGT